MKVLCEIDAWATCSCSIKSFLRNDVRSSETWNPGGDDSDRFLICLSEFIKLFDKNHPFILHTKFILFYLNKECSLFSFLKRGMWRNLFYFWNYHELWTLRRMILRELVYSVCAIYILSSLKMMNLNVACFLKLKTIHKCFLCPYKRQSSMLCFIAFKLSRTSVNSQCR